MRKAGMMVLTGVLLWHGTGAWAEERTRVDMAAIEKNAVYEKECASCHIAYAPSLLPARSWQKIMGDLRNHFGDDAEVSEGVRKAITAYLVRNAAEHDSRRYAKSMLGLLKADETPMRISDTAYFKLMHDTVKPRMVQANPDVGSFARCEVCHHQAMQGKFNRIDAVIPNYFRRAGRFVRN